METWKRISGYGNMYRVSNLGRITGKNKLLLKPTRERNGYLMVTLRDGKVSKRNSMHRLVLTAFRGKPAVGYECAHLNGKRDDNRIANLKWVTRKENMSHKVAHGTQIRGETNWNAQLKDADVIKFRKECLNSADLHQLAKQTGFARSALKCAISGKTFKHLPGAHPIQRRRRVRIWCKSGKHKMDPNMRGTSRRCLICAKLRARRDRAEKRNHK